jgi:hypothetical protein
MTASRGLIAALILAALPIALGWAEETPPAASPPATPDTVVLHRTVNVLGQDVHSSDGKATGRIIDLLVNQVGKPRAAVIDFGGFLGVGTRRVAVDWSLIHLGAGDKAPATVDMTLAQLQAAPEYKDTAGPVAVANPPPVPPPSATTTP